MSYQILKFMRILIKVGNFTFGDRYSGIRWDMVFFINKSLKLKRREIEVFAFYRIIKKLVSFFSNS